MAKSPDLDFGGMRYRVAYTTKFKKELALMIRRGKKVEKLRKVVKKLADGEILEPKYNNHALTGNYVGFQECHIEPDWLLVYKYEDDRLVLTLSETGTHSDLFGK